MSIRLGNSVIASGTASDNKSITANASNELQTVGVINQNAQNVALKSWMGTLAEYNALVNSGDVDENTIYNITDDMEGGESVYTKEEVDEGFLGTNKITNCITEIPQDIKLELDNGTLTLKAGSKVYIPNGFESDGVTPHFDFVTTTSDITQNYGTGRTGCLVVVSNNTFEWSTTDDFTSGTTQPTSSWWVWYDTTTNKIKFYNGSTTVEGVCFPIAIITENAGSGLGSGIKSIDQVFNGFGYIGSTVFALPGVKGLASNGRNANGTYNTTVVSVNSVITKDITGTGYKEFTLTSASMNWGTGGYFVDIDGYLYSRNNHIKATNAVIFGNCDIITAGTFNKISFKKAFSISDSSYVVDIYSNGSSWYRVYSDGWCEQGGQIVGTASGTLSYLKTFKDTNYTIFMHGVGTYSGTITGNGMFNPKTRANGSCTYFQDSNVTTIMWEAKGYIS